MENNNIEDSQGADRPSIPVVNGEAKPSNGKKRKVLFSLLTFVLVAGLGTSLFMLQEEKQRSNQFSDQAYGLLQDKAKLEAEKQTQLPAENQSDDGGNRVAPEGWNEYVSKSKNYDFFHPKDWKVSESKSSGFGEYKPISNIEVSENTSRPGPKAGITLQIYDSLSKDDLFKLLKSKQYWDGDCQEHTSVIADTLVDGLSCGPEKVDGLAITNYYVFEKDKNTFVIYHDQLAGEAGPQQQALIYQGVLSSLAFK